MSERNYYVLCDDNCRFRSMTSEQIIAAIAEATGATPTHIDDAFITKIKEQNGNQAVKIWLGTEAQYNALSTKAADTIYLIKNDTGAIRAKLDLESDVETLETLVETLSATKQDKYLTVTCTISSLGVVSNPSATYAQIKTAYDGGKQVILRTKNVGNTIFNEYNMCYFGDHAEKFKFSKTENGVNYVVTVDDDDVWTYEAFGSVQVATIDYNSGALENPSKTYAEIMASIEFGIIPVLLMNNADISVKTAYLFVRSSSGTIYFTQYYGENSHTVTVTEQNVWTYQ